MWKTSQSATKTMSLNLLQQLSSKGSINQLRTVTVSCQYRQHFLQPPKFHKNQRNLTQFHPFEQNKDHNSNNDSKHNHGRTGAFVLGFSAWEFFTGKESVKETDEDKLITTIKRSVLLIQKGEYKAAERMLHLALKSAQELQNHDGITYIYDVLANLALEAGDFDKAEKLFVQVMQRLFGDGYKEDSIKMLHLSAKMAHLCHFQGKTDKAIQGFVWTLEKLEQKLKQYSNDKELYELFGLVKNWYGQALIDKKLFADARKYFQEAYNIYIEIHGPKTEEGIMILNNLSIAANEMGDVAAAVDFLREAINLANEFPNMVEIGVFHANLGFLYLKQGLVNEALEACKFGRRLGLRFSHTDSVELADHCINELKKVKVNK